MTLWDELNNLLNKRQEDIKNSLASGNVSSYDDYRHAVGIYEGLEWSKSCLQHMVKQHIFEDDDEED